MWIDDDQYTHIHGTEIYVWLIIVQQHEEEK